MKHCKRVPWIMFVTLNKVYSRLQLRFFSPEVEFWIWRKLFSKIKICFITYFFRFFQSHWRLWYDNVFLFINSIGLSRAVIYGGTIDLQGLQKQKILIKPSVLSCFLSRKNDEYISFRCSHDLHDNLSRQYLIRYIHT